SAATGRRLRVLARGRTVGRPARMTDQRRLAALVFRRSRGLLAADGKKRERHAGGGENSSPGGGRLGESPRMEDASSRPQATVCCWSSQAWSMQLKYRRSNNGQRRH